jgi:hypothetical protein
MILGAAVGLLMQLFRVNFEAVWQAFRFGGIVVVKNWYWRPNP